MYLCLIIIDTIIGNERGQEMKKKVLSRLVVFLLMVVMTGLLPITAFAGNGNNESVLTKATPGCSYQTHVQNDGWQGFKSNGDMSGTFGRSLRLEGIEIKLDNQGYDLGVSYQTIFRILAGKLIRTVVGKVTAS